MLGIGMDDGKVHTLKVSKDLNFMQYEEVISTKAHSARVMGLAIETRRGYFYSVGEDKKFKIFDRNMGENIIGKLALLYRHAARQKQTQEPSH